MKKRNFDDPQISRMIDMKKVLFYPLWKVDELEKKLHQFELDGWRVTRIAYSYIYEFTKSKSKDSDYIVTYIMHKDRTHVMYEYNYKLLSEYSANKINSKATGYDVFRVTGEDRDFDDIKYYRKYYFKHVLFQFMLISLIFLILALSLMINLSFQPILVFERIFIYIYSFFSIVCFSYRMYGYIKQAIKCKDN